MPDTPAREVHASPVIPANADWPTVQRLARQAGGSYGGEKWYFPSPAQRDEFVRACAAAGLQLPGA